MGNMEPEAPRARLTAGDAVLECPHCRSVWLGHAYLAERGEYLFWCRECNNTFMLTIERRQEQVCFLWRYVQPKHDSE
jgi:hypothetical protein